VTDVGTTIKKPAGVRMATTPDPNVVETDIAVVRERGDAAP
jgi:hypothetical protein